MSSLLLSMGLLLGLLILPTGAAAQEQTDAPPTLIEHLRSELRSKDPVRQGNALMDIITLTNCTGSCIVDLRSMQNKRISLRGETSESAVVDLTALAPDVLKRYHRRMTDGNRLLALSALLHLGDEKILNRLIERGGPAQSPEMERNMHRRLAAFYVSKYPEIAERTIQTQQLSLEDVTRAKALRVKRVKKAVKSKN